MKKAIFTAIAVFSVLAIYAGQANACTVMPVNKVAQKNTLVAAALTHLNVSVEDMTSLEIVDYYGTYIWTRMCPKGVNAGALLTISFTNIDDIFTHGCTAIVRVVKQQIYKDVNYKFEMVQPPTCLE